MREFIISSDLQSRVGAFASAGQRLNNEYKKLDGAGVSSLTASVAFIRQHEQIYRLIEAYAALVEKDAQDLDAMYQAVQLMDDELAGRHASSGKAAPPKQTSADEGKKGYTGPITGGTATSGEQGGSAGPGSDYADQAPGLADYTAEWGQSFMDAMDSGGGSPYEFFVDEMHIHP